MLQAALSRIEVYRDSRVLVGFETADDAGVYLLDEERALVQTVDFFTPVVDDPYAYGQIAAANSLSDVYAMGAEPLFALAVVGFPSDELEPEILHEVLRGGADKMREAEVSVIGGHSVKDPEMKFGYAVTGLVHPQRVWSNASARPGDRLLLTKPLGTGIVTTGIKFGKTPPEVAEEAIRWMGQLNRQASRLLRDFEVHSATDITGFGLLGHAFEMAAGSGVSVRIRVAELPLLSGVRELARAGMLPGGIQSNRRLVDGQVSWNQIDKLTQQILLDPQTSGGLLVSLPAAQVEEACRALQSRGCLAAQVGEVETAGSFRLLVE